MPSCAVSTCKNSSASVGNSGITFHPFPRYEKQALEWFIKCKRRDKKSHNSADRICSEHFQPSDFERDIGHELLGKPPNPKLKSNATPTLNLPFIIIKPAEARKLLPPSLARQLSRSSLQKRGSCKRKAVSPTQPSPASENVHSKSNLEKNNGVTSNSRPGTNASAETSEEIKEPVLPVADEVTCINTDTHCKALLQSILTDESFMDVTLITQNKSLKAHRAILRQASGYFKQLLTLDRSVTSEFEVKLDVNYEDLSNLIIYIYEGKVSVKASDLNRFLILAETLEIFSLLEEADRIKASVKKELTDTFPEKITSLRNNGKSVSLPRHRVKTDSQINGIKDSAHAKIKRKKGFCMERNEKENIVKYCLSELKNGLFAALYLLY